MTLCVLIIVPSISWRHYEIHANSVGAIENPIIAARVIMPTILNMFFYNLFLVRSNDRVE